MHIAARIYLIVMLLLFGAIGLFALTMPDRLAPMLGFLPQGGQGTAELRGLYGGAFLSWAALGVAAWRIKALRPGLLIALGIMLGAIAAGRVVSLAIDHEPGFNIPAMVSEGLVALACWVISRGERASA